jgi:ribosome-associated toxin RatA of RatAB toxin-antitoxin module
MYSLVNDVESYPYFLPWCTDAEVFDPRPDRLRATISLNAGRIKQVFTTENTMQPGRRIDVHLVSGPFRYLEGHWEFQPEGSGGCRVFLEMNFEFKNKVVKLALDKIFNHIVTTLVDAFRERAEQVYGRR